MPEAAHDLVAGAWIVPWIESESGWGQRVEDYSVYSTKEQAEKHTKERVDAMRKEEAKKGYKSGNPPSIYWYPDEPRFHPIGPKTVELLRKGKGHIIVDRLKELDD